MFFHLMHHHQDQISLYLHIKSLLKLHGILVVILISYLILQFSQRLFALLSTECLPSSGTVNVTSSSVTQCIRSPYYSSKGSNGKFIPDASCTWILKARADQKIALWFNGSYFGLYRDSSGACLHYVEVKYLTSHKTRGQRLVNNTLAELSQFLNV